MSALLAIPLAILTYVALRYAVPIRCLNCRAHTYVDVVGRDLRLDCLACHVTVRMRATAGKGVHLNVTCPSSVSEEEGEQIVRRVTSALDTDP